MKARGCFYLNLDITFVLASCTETGCTMDERNPLLFRAAISGLCAMQSMQNATYFFLVVSDSLCWSVSYVYVRCGLTGARYSNTVIFSDFSLRMFVNVILYREPCWCAEWVLYFGQPETDAYGFLSFFLPCEREARCSMIVDSLNSC